MADRVVRKRPGRDRREVDDECIAGAGRAGHAGPSSEDRPDIAGAEPAEVNSPLERSDKRFATVGGLEPRELFEVTRERGGT